MSGVSSQACSAARPMSCRRDLRDVSKETAPRCEVFASGIALLSLRTAILRLWIAIRGSGIAIHESRNAIRRLSIAIPEPCIAIPEPRIAIQSLSIAVRSANNAIPDAKTSHRGAVS